MAQVKSRGGTRPGAGRKASADKKIVVFAYVLQSQVDALGKDQAKAIAEAAITRAAKKVVFNKAARKLAN